MTHGPIAIGVCVAIEGTPYSRYGNHCCLSVFTLPNAWDGSRYIYPMWRYYSFETRFFDSPNNRRNYRCSSHTYIIIRRFSTEYKKYHLTRDRAIHITIRRFFEGSAASKSLYTLLISPACLYNPAACNVLAWSLLAETNSESVVAFGLSR